MVRRWLYCSGFESSSASTRSRAQRRRDVGVSAIRRWGRAAATEGFRRRRDMDVGRRPGGHERPAKLVPGRSQHLLGGNPIVHGVPREPVGHAPQHDGWPHRLRGCRDSVEPSRSVASGLLSGSCVACALYSCAVNDEPEKLQELPSAVGAVTEAPSVPSQPVPRGEPSLIGAKFRPAPRAIRVEHVVCGLSPSFSNAHQSASGKSLISRAVSAPITSKGY